jgi:citronellol/citronellal dehydrogenase
MSIAEPSALLRPGLLDGISIVLARAGEREGRELGFAETVLTVCAGLGARVAVCAPVAVGEAEEREAAADAAVEAALGELGSASLLIVDGAGLFELADAAGALAETLQGTWDVTRSVANRAFIPESAGGRIILMAPRSGSGAGHAVAAAAGLENLARTLSIEWARYAITAVAIVPGAETASEEVAALCAWLASPAGDYFSGCLLDLTGPRATGA